jgi:hypothetical protein
MNVKILTFSKEQNNGAFLQCYALSRVVQSLGHHVELIEVEIPHQKRGLVGGFKESAWDFLYGFSRRKYLPRFIGNNVGGYRPDDVYIVGSDQVWNPRLTGSRWEDFFFSFLPEGARRISYAASFGMAEWGYPELTTRASKLLSKFNAVSVRELTGVNICNQMFGRNDAVECIDPVLLLDDFTDLICAPASPRQELLVYESTSDSAYWNLCQRVATSLGLEPRVQGIQRSNSLRLRRYYSPGGWMANFRDCSFVISTSFHAILCAIKFQKPFLVVTDHNPRLVRLNNILEKLGFQERMIYNEQISPGMDLTKYLELDYSSANRIIKAEREKALNFLKNQLS